MHVHDDQLRKIAADAVDVLGVAVGEIRPVAPAAHQEHGDGAVGAVLIDGVQPGIVDIHGDGAAAGFHTRAAQVPVCHRALDFRNSGNGIAAVHTGNAHEAAGLFAHDVHEVVVGDVAHVGALASGHHAQRHARVVHFPVQQVRVALFDGGRHLHQEIVAPALRLFRIAVQVATEVVFQRGTQAGINDSHNDQAPLECFARLGGIVWGRAAAGYFPGGNPAAACAGRLGRRTTGWTSPPMFPRGLVTGQSSLVPPDGYGKWEPARRWGRKPEGGNPRLQAAKLVSSCSPFPCSSARRRGAGDTRCPAMPSPDRWTSMQGWRGRCRPCLR